MGISHLNDANFNSEVIKANQPVLVDFWAEWCAPCKRITPIIEEISKEYDGKIKVVKVNIKEGKKTTSGLGIMSIPTLILFKDGRISKQFVGLISKKELKSMIDSNI